MTFCYYYVFVIKCLSLIVACNPGSPFQSCIPLLKKTPGFWAILCDMDTDFTVQWHKEGELMFEDSFKWYSSSATMGVQCSKSTVAQLQHCWHEFGFKANASFAFSIPMPALRQSPGAGSMRAVVCTFNCERCYAENHTHISSLRHGSSYNHQLLLCWLGLNLHGRQWREKD